MLQEPADGRYKGDITSVILEGLDPKLEDEVELSGRSSESRVRPRNEKGNVQRQAW